MVHAYRALIEGEMQTRGWTQTQLAAAADLSKQVINNIVTDARETLRQRPDPETVQGLAHALRIPESTIWLSVVQALGIPTEFHATVVHDVGAASNEQLLQELGRRLAQKGGAEHGSPSDTEAAPVTPFPKRGRMLEDATNEAEAARGSGGKGRNRSNVHGGALGSFDPGADPEGPEGGA